MSFESSRKNPLREKSYDFALRIVKAAMFLFEKKEFVLSKQMLKSGTGIGANVEEAMHAISKKEFICKLQIALKEAHETYYWIRLLRDSQFFTVKQANSLLHDADELIRLLTSIIKTAKLRPTR